MPLPPRDHRLDAREAPSLVAGLARLARSSSDGALVACAAAGLAEAAAVGMIWPALWPLALVGLVLACFGGWGVADRAAGDLREPAGRHAGTLRLLLGLRLACGLMGVAALVGLLLALATRTIVTTGGGWF